MKSIEFVTVMAGILHGVCALGQGTFQNLDFESANVPFVPPLQFGADVAVSDGLPGWSAYLGTGQVSMIFHNNVSLGGAAISIFGPQWFAQDILQGRYSVQVGGSTAGSPTSAAIAQLGRLPDSVGSLILFVAPQSTFETTFAGHLITLAQVGSGPNYNILAGDISAFAGQTGELRFTAPPGGGGILDNIWFSNIPEPSVAGLLGLVAVLGWWATKRRR